MIRFRLALLCLPMLVSYAFGTAAAFAAAQAAHQKASGSRQPRGHARASAYEYELHATPAAPHHHQPRAHRTPRKVAPTSKRGHVVTGSAPAREESREATVAQVLATPCENAQLTPEAGNAPVIRAAVLCLINRERAQHGKAPLAPQPNLEKAAEAHAQEMIALDYFEHVSPSGLTPVQRVRDDGYISDPQAGYIIGENLAWGTYNLATPEAIVAAWIASPEHLANILEGEYRDTGIAVVAQVPPMLADGAPGATYAQEFGVIVH